MLNFLDFNKKKEKYEIVKSRSNLPMFVLPLPDSLDDNLTSDDDDRKVEVMTDLEIEIEIDEIKSSTKSHSDFF